MALRLILDKLLDLFISDDVGSWVHSEIVIRYRKVGVGLSNERDILDLRMEIKIVSSISDSTGIKVVEVD